MQTWSAYVLEYAWYGHITFSFPYVISSFYLTHIFINYPFMWFHKLAFLTGFPYAVLSKNPIYDIGDSLMKAKSLTKVSHLAIYFYLSVTYQYVRTIKYEVLMLACYLRFPLAVPLSLPSRKDWIFSHIMCGTEGATACSQQDHCK